MASKDPAIAGNEDEVVLRMAEEVLILRGKFIEQIEPFGACWLQIIGG